MEELRRALASAHSQVLRDSAQSSALGANAAGVKLCRRKWSLEAVLRKLDQAAATPAVIGMMPVPRSRMLQLMAA